MNTNQQKWALADQLISAKQNVDSLLFLLKNERKIPYIIEKKRVQDIKQQFCISTCNVLSSLSKDTISRLKKEYTSIYDLYYERNKKQAHRDKNFETKLPQDLNELVMYFKTTLLLVREKCSDILPENITLDFLPWDSDSFRLLEGITADKESEIRNKKAKLFNSKFRNHLPKNTVEDLNDLDYVDKTQNISVLIVEGLTIYEGLQNRQKSFITLNAKFDTNIWPTFNQKTLKTYEKLCELEVIDRFGIITPPEELSSKQITFLYKLFRPDL